MAERGSCLYPERMDDVVYAINNRDKIVFVNDGWDRFAAANNGEKHVSQKILNRPLWDFITGAATRDIYRQIIGAARLGRICQFHFRCDAPQERRRLMMNIASGAEGNVLFKVSVITTEDRTSQPLLNPRTGSTENFLTVCSWCKKMSVNGQWVEVEKAVALLNLFEEDNLPQLTHGICESCLNKMDKVIDKMSPKRPG